MNFIIKHLDVVPPKSFKRASKVNKVLRELYDAARPGQVLQFDPKLASVNPQSLRNQLSLMVRQGVFPKGTQILARGKEWYFKKG